MNEKFTLRIVNWFACPLVWVMDHHLLMIIISIFIIFIIIFIAYHLSKFDLLFTPLYEAFLSTFFSLSGNDLM